jgi:endogenous inhibitor of DNA gyrase (YacG/DUF329 family)
MSEFSKVPCLDCGAQFFVDENFWVDDQTVQMNCPNCQVLMTIPSLTVQLIQRIYD